MHPVVEPFNIRLVQLFHLNCAFFDHRSIGLVSNTPHDTKAMGFCRRCGDIVTDQRCNKCGGSVVGEHPPITYAN